MKIFFSVGEPSGDLHGANLVRALQARCPDVECVGFGGPKMAAAGFAVHRDLTQLAIMWFGRVLLHLPKFFRYRREADEYFERERPDAVVLIDYPGFNWHIARTAKQHGIPVFYYGTPQLWAWAEWRVEKMRRTVDHALCKLPFEEQWLRDRGVHATYVGHPYFDELRGRALDQQFIAAQAGDPRPLVSILPGSRTQEVKHNLADLLKAADRIQQQVPDVRFAVASFKESQAELARKLVDESGLTADIYVGKTPELIESATAALAVSGSVSLELLYHATPTVVLYRISRLAYAVQRRFRKVRYITLVNLLTTDDLFPAEPAVFDPASPDDAHVLMPEYLTCEDRTEDLARHVVGWLTAPSTRQDLIDRMRDLGETVAHGGASERAADYIVKELTNIRAAAA